MPHGCGRDNPKYTCPVVFELAPRNFRCIPFCAYRNWLGFQDFCQKEICKHARAIGLGKGRGPTWPLRTHHVDGGVWNGWVCACANRTRPTRGTRRELGSEVNRNEELVDIYRQTPHTSSNEVSRLGWVLLGIAAQQCRNNSQNKILHNKSFCECLNSKVGAFDAH